jgi:hypothetical protein
MRGNRTRIVPGLHIVRKRLAHGMDRWFVYAWRGGPCIHKQDGAKPVIGPAILSAAMAVREGKKDGNTLAAVIEAYQLSPEYTRLRDSTKTAHRLRRSNVRKCGPRFCNGATNGQRSRAPPIPPAG